MSENTCIACRNWILREKIIKANMSPTKWRHSDLAFVLMMKNGTISPVAENVQTTNLSL